MDQLTKDWIDTIYKAAVAVGVIVAALNYRNQTKTKRAEWLKELFEKFYENATFKEVRKWIETGDLDNKIDPDDNITSESEEKLTDYLNFFEFIGTLKSENQLRAKDVSNLFDYYLKKIKNSDSCNRWVYKEAFGFEKLRTLLNEIS